MRFHLTFVIEWIFTMDYLLSIFNNQPTSSFSTRIPPTFMIIAFPFNSGKRISHLLLPNLHVLYIKTDSTPKDQESLVALVS